MLASVYHVDLQLLICCQSKCTVQLWMHLSVCFLKPCVLGINWNVNPTIIEVLNLGYTCNHLVQNHVPFPVKKHKGENIQNCYFACGLVFVLLGWMGWSLNAGRGKRFYHLHNIQISSGAHPASYWVGTRFLFLEVESPGCEINHVLPTSAQVKNGVTHLFALCAFMEWTRKMFTCTDQRMWAEGIPD